jgi:putative oxygen-independent coproporphyrinogen III oxidase
MLDLQQSISRLAPKTPQTLHSIFIGGGTPSLFSSASIGNLLTEVNQIITLPNNCEITLEANPGTFEQQKFKDFKSVGINRLSIGVQSFDNNCLTALGRIHDAEQAKQAITAAKNIDFNLNIDLMHSLPGQTVDLALTDINIATSFEPNHLSWYQLTIEPNTKFAKQPPILPKSHTLDSIYYQGLELLNNKNYSQYEISAFAHQTALDNNKSVHNLNYWRYGDYIGIGAGAHSKITTQSGIERQWKQKSPARYLDHNIDKISGFCNLEAKDILLEYMMNKLRIFESITEEEFYLYTNYKFTDIEHQIKQALDHKWLVLDQNTLCTTDLGRRFLNDLILLFA